MGIPGLSTFVHDRKLFKSHQLHSTILVIDGHNLIHSLYRKSQYSASRLDFRFGGDYVFWAAYVRSFFETLAACEVKPIVLLDGAIHPSFEKLSTMKSRIKDKLSNSMKVYNLGEEVWKEGTTQWIEIILPLHTTTVFVQVCKEMQIQHLYRCMFETDDVISSICADFEQMSQPSMVLSDDSDFLVENIAGGVISTTSLLNKFKADQHKPSSLDSTVTSITTYKYIQCERYHFSYLQNIFSGIKTELAALAGAFLGNDYITQDRIPSIILDCMPKTEDNILSQGDDSLLTSQNIIISKTPKKKSLNSLLFASLNAARNALRSTASTKVSITNPEEASTSANAETSSDKTIDKSQIELSNTDISINTGTESPIIDETSPTSPDRTEIIPPTNAFNNSHRKAFPQEQIFAVFHWLSQQDSVEGVLTKLRLHFGRSDHKTIEYIEEYHVARIKDVKNTQNAITSVDDYFFYQLGQKLLSMIQNGFSDTPSWIREKYLSCDVQKRTLSVVCSRMELCRPLIEDYSLEQCSYEASFELCSYIYGLLLPSSSSTEMATVTRFVREGTSIATNQIEPRYSLPNSNKPMHKLSEIKSLSEQARLGLFCQITGLSKSFMSDLTKIMSLQNDPKKKNNFSIEPSLIKPMRTMLIALVHFCRHSKPQIDIWIEFVYALFVSIILGGYFRADLPYFAIASSPISTPTHFVHFPNASLRTSLEHTLNWFNQSPLTFNQTAITRIAHQPRVVHLYNSFQSTLKNICWLAQCLSLSSEFGTDQLMCHLQGTAIYNLTTYFATSLEKPLLLHLKENIFTPKGVGAAGPWKQVISKLLDHVMQHSNRTLLVEDSVVMKAVKSGGIVPGSMMKNCKSTRAATDGDVKGYFVFATNHLI